MFTRILEIGIYTRANEYYFIKSGKTHTMASFPCCPRLVTVGDVLPEIWRYAWYAIEHDAYFTAEVDDPVPCQSPSVQGGLEILLQLTVSWEDFDKLEILRKKISIFTFHTIKMIVKIF